ncbi:MAG TPA: hypothetical protein VHX61_11515 [Rhizomicrobium sp.]|jgi:ABC-type Fe3+-hydroxamate transport system substrate-binding protein|nr:hypothetical protein [Rhizomicrobium sp.]
MPNGLARSVVTMDPGDSIEGAEALMLRLGDYLGRHDAAAQIVAGWKRDMEETLRTAERRPPDKRPSVRIMHFGQIANDYLGLAPKGPAEQILE